MTNSIIYTKIFTDFEKGIKELISIVPMAEEYMTKDGIILTTEEEVVDNLIAYLNKNKPVTTNPNYPYTYSFSANAFSLSFRTDKRLSFGWKIRIMEDGKPSYSFKVSFPNASTKSTCEFKLIEAEWKSFEYINKKFRKPAHTTTEQSAVEE